VARVVLRKLVRKAAKGGKTSVIKKRVFNAAGQPVRILSVDSNSDSFSKDLHTIFVRNVAKARRENKKRFGSPDRVLKKA
jgi:hypothetical protein